MKRPTLGQLVEFTNGGTPSRSKPDFWNGSTPWITGADIAEDGSISARSFISDAAVKMSATNVLPAGTVLLLTRTSVGKVGVLSEATAINQDITAITPSGQLDSRYLVHFLRASKSKLLNDLRGATIKGVTRDDVASLELALPPLDEQRRIAAILDHADALRAKRRQVLSHLDALAQSIFHDMFSTSDFVRVPLKDAIKWNSGRFLPAKNQRGGTHPVYGGNGINGSHDEYMFEEPRLVVGRVGAYCGAVHVTRPFSWVTDNALVATLLRDDLTLDYLLPALTIANLNQYAGVSGQPSISGGKIGSVQLPVPPVTFQREFANRVRAIESRRNDVLRASCTDRELVASLQSRAFQGEL